MQWEMEAERYYVDSGGRGRLMCDAMESMVGRLYSAHFLHIFALFRFSDRIMMKNSPRHSSFLLGTLTSEKVRRMKRRRGSSKAPHARSNRAWLWLNMIHCKLITRVCAIKKIALREKYSSVPGYHISGKCFWTLFFKQSVSFVIVIEMKILLPQSILFIINVQRKWIWSRWSTKDPGGLRNFHVPLRCSLTSDTCVEIEGCFVVVRHLMSPLESTDSECFHFVEASSPLTFPSFFSFLSDAF